MIRYVPVLYWVAYLGLISQRWLLEGVFREIFFWAGILAGIVVTVWHVVLMAKQPTKASERIPPATH